LCIVIPFATILSNFIIRIDEIEDGIGDLFIHRGQRHQQVATETSRLVRGSKTIEHGVS
jgi:hypothetical protein